MGHAAARIPAAGGCAIEAGPACGRQGGSGPHCDRAQARADTFRTAYTVQFPKAVYALHCFQKKSPSGIRTAGKDVKLIRERLKLARADYEVRYGK